jgi:hypothetical protein
VKLLPCRACGAECRIEGFGGGVYVTPWDGWLCSKAELFGGTCPDKQVYLSEAAWNDRPAVLLPEVREEREAIIRLLKKDLDWLGEATANYVRRMTETIQRGDHRQ